MVFHLKVEYIEVILLGYISGGWAISYVPANPVPQSEVPGEGTMNSNVPGREMGKCAGKETAAGP